MIKVLNLPIRVFDNDKICGMRRHQIQIFVWPEKKCVTVATWRNRRGRLQLISNLCEMEVSDKAKLCLLKK